MNRLLAVLLLLVIRQSADAQELYIVTEPASNMPARSLGFRLTNKLMDMKMNGEQAFRVEPEVMWGINKNVMVHAQLFGSNMFQDRFRFEGASIYSKWRFLSVDDIHSHFRMAAYGRVSVINNPAAIREWHRYTVDHGNGDVIEHEELKTYGSDEIDLEGNNSGFNAGLVATQLFHKTAISGSLGFTQALNNTGENKLTGASDQMLQYSLSAGYLLFPRVYKSYGQPNLNLYVEFLGGSSLDKKGYFVDAVPALQLILNSVARIDLAYRTQLSGNMRRYSEQSWLLRLEYNFLSAFDRK